MSEVAEFAKIYPFDDVQLAYQNYRTCRFSTTYALETTKDCENGTGLLFDNRYRTLLQLLVNQEYFNENDVKCFIHQSVLSPAPWIRFYLPSASVANPGASAVFGFPLAQDPLMTFVSCLDSSNVPSFVSRYVVQGLTVAEACDVHNKIVLAIKHVWDDGIPWSFSGVAVFRECVDKALNHLRLHGTQLFDEKMRLNNLVGGYNPFRREFRLTCASGFGLQEPPYIRHHDILVGNSGGYFDPSKDPNYRKACVVDIDDFPTPYQIMKMVLGDSPHYSPFSGMYSGYDHDIISRFPKGSFIPIPTASLKHRLLGGDGEYNVPMFRHQSGYNCHVGINASRYVVAEIEDLMNSGISEVEWCALMLSVPGLADAYNAVEKSRYYYDVNAAKLVACESYCKRRVVPGYRNKHFRGTNDVVVWSSRVNDIDHFKWDEKFKEGSYCPVTVEIRKQAFAFK